MVLWLNAERIGMIPDAKFLGALLVDGRLTAKRNKLLPCKATVPDTQVQTDDPLEVQKLHGRAEMNGMGKGWMSIMMSVVDHFFSPGKMGFGTRPSRATSYGTFDKNAEADMKCAVKGIV